MSYMWVLSQHDLYPYKKGTQTQMYTVEGHVKAKGKDGYLKIKERGLRGNQTS